MNHYQHNRHPRGAAHSNPLTSGINNNNTNNNNNNNSNNINSNTCNVNSSQQISRKDRECRKCGRKFKSQMDLDQHHFMKHRAEGDTSLRNSNNNNNNNNNNNTNNNHDTVPRFEFEKLKVRLERSEKSKNKLYNERNHAMVALQKVERKRGQLQIEKDALLVWISTLMKQASLHTRGTVQSLVASARRDQVEMLGSEGIYRRVDEQLHQLKVDPYFSREQFRLYRWRKKFFYFHYGSHRANLWYTDGSDEQHNQDTVPYQNFDEVVGKLSLVESGISVYFDHNEKISSHANYCFNGTDNQLPWIIGQLNDCSDLELEKYNISFSEAAHMIVQMYSHAPPSLQFIAMRSVLANCLPLHHLPRILQYKAVFGMFGKYDPIPQYLSEEGRLRYEVLKTYFGVHDEDFRYDVQQRLHPKYEAL